MFWPVSLSSTERPIGGGQGVGAQACSVGLQWNFSGTSVGEDQAPSGAMKTVHSSH